MKAEQPARFTVLGGAGFIGSHLVQHLVARGHQCASPGRAALSGLSGPLGHVVYCIGLTADFRSRPIDTVEAHVSVLARLLRDAEFDSLLFLSSTRVYQHSDGGEEGATFSANPGDPSDLYNLSKLTGESLCLSLNRPSIRVARLSNVYGPDFTSENFLISVIRDAINLRKVRLGVDPRGEKDYVHIQDVVEMLEQIALGGTHRIYNVAAGRNVSNSCIMEKLSELVGCEIEWAPASAVMAIRPISIARLHQEFGFKPRQLENELDQLVRLFQSQRDVTRA